MKSDLAIIVDGGRLSLVGPVARNLDRCEFPLSDDWDVGADLFAAVSSLHDDVGDLLRPDYDRAVEALRKYTYDVYPFWRRWIPHDTYNILGEIRAQLDNIARLRVPRIAILGASLLQFPFDLLPFGNFRLARGVAPTTLSDLARCLPAFSFECFQESSESRFGDQEDRIGRVDREIHHSVLVDLLGAKKRKRQLDDVVQRPMVVRCSRDTKRWRDLAEYMQQEHSLESGGPIPDNTSDQLAAASNVGLTLVRPPRSASIDGRHVLIYVHAHGDVGTYGFEVRLGFGQRFGRKRVTISTADLEESRRALSGMDTSLLMERGAWSVLLNCCFSAGLDQTDFGDWPHLLVDSGARFVCGTRFQISESVAAEFAKMLTVESSVWRFSLAALRTRQRFLCEFNNPLALIFVGLEGPRLAA